MKSTLGNPWERFLLSALMIAPAHAGLALLMVLMVAIGLVFWFILKRDSGALSWDWLLAGPLLGYFVFFYVGGVIHGQDFLAPFASMKGNLPLVLLGLSALLLPKSSVPLSVGQVGYWSRRAVLLITLAALSLYAITHMAPGWHQDVIEQAWRGRDGGRLQMYSRNPLMFASMLLALSYLSLMGWHDMPAFEKKLAVAALLTGLIVILFWAQARGAMLVAIPLTFLLFRYVRPQPVSLVLPLLTGVIVACLLYGFNKDLRNTVDSVVDRLRVGLTSVSTSGVKQDVSVSIRLNMYKFGMEAAIKSPWFGHGYQNRFAVVRSSMPGVNAGHLHNGYLNHLVAGGIPGLVFFCWLLALPALMVRRARPTDAALRYMAAVVFFVMAGTALSTAVLGHYVNSTFYGLLFLILSRTLVPREARRNVR